MTKDIITSPFVFEQWCKRLKPVWAFDTETNSLKWLHLRMVGFSICDGRQTCYVDCDNKYRNKFKEILQQQINKAKLIIGHNINFDIMVLRKEGINI